MTNTEKEQQVTVEGMQAADRKALNKGIGNSCTCSTAAATAAKTVTLGNTFQLVQDATILVKFTNAITVANATLAVTHTPFGASEATTEAAKPIYYRGAALPAGLVKAGTMVMLRYNGTQFDIVGDLTPSGFSVTSDETTGYDTFEAIGSAEITEDDTKGYDEFTF